MLMILAPHTLNVFDSIFVVSRLDQILGKPGGKKVDVYESKQSLASRVVKVERSVMDITDITYLVLDPVSN